MARLSNITTWAGASVSGALVVVGFAFWLRGFGDAWIGFAGSVIGGLMTLLAAGIAWRVTKPTADLAKIQMLLAEREVLLSTKRDYEKELSANEETIALVAVISTQIDAAANFYGLQAGFAWLADIESKLASFRKSATDIFNQAVLVRARTSAEDDGKTRDEALKSIKEIEFVVSQLVSTMREMINKSPQPEDQRAFNKLVQNARMSAFLTSARLVNHRASIEKVLSRIVEKIHKNELIISSGVADHSAASR